jgi:hypothetical protein
LATSALMADAFCAIGKYERQINVAAILPHFNLDVTVGSPGWIMSPRASRRTGVPYGHRIVDGSAVPVSRSRRFKHLHRAHATLRLLRKPAGAILNDPESQLLTNVMKDALIQCHPGIETSSSANIKMIAAAPRAISASSRLRMFPHPLTGDAFALDPRTGQPPCDCHHQNTEFRLVSTRSFD